MKSIWPPLAAIFFWLIFTGLGGMDHSAPAPRSYWFDGITISMVITSSSNVCYVGNFWTLWQMATPSGLAHTKISVTDQIAFWIQSFSRWFQLRFPEWGFFNICFDFVCFLCFHRLCLNKFLLIPFKLWRNSLVASLKSRY